MNYNEATPLAMLLYSVYIYGISPVGRFRQSRIVVGKTLNPSDNYQSFATHLISGGTSFYRVLASEVSGVDADIAVTK